MALHPQCDPPRCPAWTRTLTLEDDDGGFYHCSQRDGQASHTSRTRCNSLTHSYCMDRRTRWDVPRRSIPSRESGTISAGSICSLHLLDSMMDDTENLETTKSMFQRGKF